MPKTAILTGVLLALLGPIFYFLGEAGHRSLTAFIPVPFGLLIAGSGAAALHPARVKAGMHAAAMFALVALLGSLMGLKRWIAFLTGQPVTNPLAGAAQFLMFVICLVFLVLCVRWFISNRRARLAA
jgi:hypothetical protein